MPCPYRQPVFITSLADAARLDADAVVAQLGDDGVHRADIADPDDLPRAVPVAVLQIAIDP